MLSEFKLTFKLQPETEAGGFRQFSPFAVRAKAGG